MSRTTKILYPRTQEQAVALGERLRAARLRRRMAASEMAVRALVSRPTIARLEAGNLNVSVAVLARVLEVLSLERDLDRIVERDDLGQQLTDARLPRPYRAEGRRLADEL